MRAATLLLALALALVSTAPRADALRKLIRNVAGEAGAQTCADYLGAPPDSAGAKRSEYWVESYLSGYASKAHVDLLGAADPPNRQRLWRALCQSNPGARVSDAAETLLYQLRSRASPSDDPTLTAPTRSSCLTHAEATPDLETWATGYISGLAAATGQPLWGDLSGPALAHQIAYNCDLYPQDPLRSLIETVYDGLAARP